MLMGKFSTVLVTATMVGLVTGGCTPAGGPVPTPSPAPASQSPTESDLERQQRLDYEAAEKAYRTFRAEYQRVLQAGGAKQPTAVMKATAGGPYLKELGEVVAAFRGLELKQIGQETIKNVGYVGHDPESVSLQVCEDDRQAVVVNKEGEDQGPGEIQLSNLTVRKMSGRWKVWTGSGKKVSSCAQ